MYFKGLTHCQLSKVKGGEKCDDETLKPFLVLADGSDTKGGSSL